MSKRFYFASDFHLGAPGRTESLVREKLVVSWLDSIKGDAAEIFILGDVFDFWFEYRKAVPRGYVRLLGKLAEVADAGIPIHWFTGNHDMWIFDYLPSELGVQLYRQPIERDLAGKSLYIGHGDGLGPGDYGYKFIKKVFRSGFSQWLFARLHPNFGIGLADYFSKVSRKSGQERDKIFLGKEQEWLAIYCEELEAQRHRDYYIFGHRHLPIELELSTGAAYFNLGDWITHFTYGVLDEERFSLKGFKGEPTIYSNKP